LRLYFTNKIDFYLLGIIMPESNRNYKNRIFWLPISHCLPRLLCASTFTSAPRPPLFATTKAQELHTAVATAAFSDHFYEPASTRLARLRELMARSAPQFVARLAVYAREQLHLRSVPLMLARLHRGHSLVSRPAERQAAITGI
jgi:hypothetical protein